MQWDKMGEGERKMCWSKGERMNDEANVAPTTVVFQNDKKCIESKTALFHLA